MKYFLARKEDVANGPGIRTSIWLSGCNRQCYNCFNKNGWDFNAGNELTDNAIKNFINFGKKSFISGFSILGGEPLQQDINEMISFVSALRSVPNKTIWLWTGYKFEDLNYNQINIIKNIDVLVDGPFIDELKNANLQFKGSSNQRIIDVQSTLANNKIILYN